MEVNKVSLEVDNQKEQIAISTSKHRSSKTSKRIFVMIRGTRHVMKLLQYIQSLEPSISSIHYSAFRRHVIRYMAYEINSNFLLIRIYSIYLWTVGLVMLLSPLVILGMWLHLPFSLGQWFDVYFTYFIGLGIFLILLLPIHWLTGRNLEQFFFPKLQILAVQRQMNMRDRDFGAEPAWTHWKNLLVFSWIILLAFMSSYMFWYLLHQQEQQFGIPSSYAMVSVLFFYAFWLIGGMLFLFIGSSILYFLRRQLNSNYPNAVVCVRIFEALYLLERYPKDWSDEKFKLALVQKFEDAAVRVEFDLPRRLWPGDEITKDWLFQSFGGISQSLREQKKSILLSESGARQSVINFITKEIHYIIAGDWGSMNRVDVMPSGANFRQGLLSRLGRIFFALLKGGLPLLLLWLLQQSPFAIQSNFIDYVFILAIVYLLISILSEIDPLYQDKINALKELLNLTLKK